MAFIMQWLDVIWLPLAFFAVHKHQRIWAIGLILSCMLMMRMQVELMVGIGYGNGLIGFITTNVLDRGLMVYSVFYMLFLILAWYSPNSQGPVVMAAAISMFFMAFFVSTFVMLL